MAKNDPPDQNAVIRLLRSDLEEIRQHLEKENDRLQKEIMRLEDENRRLREACHSILKYCHIGHGDLALEYARIFAWEALEGGENDGK